MVSEFRTLTITQISVPYFLKFWSNRYLCLFKFLEYNDVYILNEILYELTPWYREDLDKLLFV